ncbi:MAG: hypothetical protein ACI8ZO_000621 [Flavobacteriales bacterium]|jgi:hypothetical protein
MPAPKLPSLFKINRNKTFEYKSRFYNERKDRLNDRRHQIAKDLELEKKGSVVDKGFLSERRSKAVSQSNSRVLLLFVIILLLAYFIIYR